jgi:putative flippase GtrA
MATATPAEPASPVPDPGSDGLALAVKPPGLQRHAVLLQQLRGFCVVAVICTATSMLMYAGLRPFTGTQWANAISLILCSVLNTDLNRRISFNVHERRLWLVDQRRGLWIMLLALAMTSGSLWVLGLVNPHASIKLELAVIVLGNVASAVARFLLLRYWIFRRLRTGHTKY